MRIFLNYTIIIISSIIFYFGFSSNKLTGIKQQLIGSEDSIISKDIVVNKLPEGYPFITNYSLNKSNNIISISADSTGLMLFADKSGITFFDGENENYLKITQSPAVLKKDDKLNLFYIACEKGFGILYKDKTGKYFYKSLSDKKYNNQKFNQILLVDNHVIISGNSSVLSINKKTNTITELYQDSDEKITGIFSFNKKLYINLIHKGLFSLSENKLVPISEDSIFTEYDIQFTADYHTGKILGLSNDKLYLFDGQNFSPYQTDVDEYISESIINGGGDLNEKEFIVTTLNGGAVIINKKDGKNINTINYRTGLPDDEIYACSTDLSGGIWFSHDYGISRVAVDIPIKTFNRFPGLQGNINDLKFYDSTLYVATGEGLFKLSEIKNYKEVEIAENKKIKYKKKIRNKSEKNTYTDEIYKKTDNDDENLNFFQRWKKRRDKNKEKDIDTKEENKPTTNSDNKKKKKKSRYKTEYKTVTEYRKVYELHSVKYIFKEIPEITGKCKTITDFNKGIIISTNSGLYFIKDNKQYTVLPDVYVYGVGCNEKNKSFFVSTSEGLFKIKVIDNELIPIQIYGNIIKEKHFKSLLYKNDSLLWAADNRTAYRLKINNDKLLSSEQFDIESESDEDIIISKNKQKTIFIKGSQAYFYNTKYDNITTDEYLSELLSSGNKLFVINDSVFTINDGINVLYKNNISDNIRHLKYVWIFDKLKLINIENNNDIWIASGNNEIYKIENLKTAEIPNFNLYLTDIKDYAGNSYGKTQELKVNSGYKNITLHFSAPAYLKKGFVSFFYGVDISDEKEFIQTKYSVFSVPELSPGKHIISIFALNALNEKSNTIKVILEIKPPFWQRTWFIIAVFSIFLILLSLGISIFYRNKQKKIQEYNRILEMKVKERTAEIKKQNELIQEQNIEIYKQYEKIEFQNKEITGSIRYAQKIQKAALPETAIYSKYISGLFILFKPRDIVSGDFYWVSEAHNRLFIAAVDCTGHGVPGAFLSMLGISFLNEIIKEVSKEKEDISAADILNSLRKKMIDTLSKHDEKEERRDGMDIALAVIDKEKMQLNFAGAYNPAYIIRNNKITKIEADRMPVGFHDKFNNIPFKNKYVKIIKDDLIYLFSDGYADQFGGKYLKKFNTRRFRELLLHISKLPVPEQKKIADKILLKWQGNAGQVDDILLIGIKI